MSDNVYVWTEAPAATNGLVPIVRAANGTSHTDPAGFDFRANYERWREHAGHPLPVWTYFYPGDKGAQVAAALLGSEDAAPLYLLDVEDEGVAWNEVRACAAALSKHGRVGITSYGLVAQCDARKIPIRAWPWDVVAPQSYYPYQLAGVAEWHGIGKQVVPSVAPEDRADWPSVAQDYAVMVWRLATVNVASVSSIIAAARNQPNWTEVMVKKLPSLSAGAKDKPGQVRYVARAQALLKYVKDLDIGKQGVDGVYGPGTAQAVDHVKHEHGLPVDGICGPEVWSLLVTGGTL
jgi:peptidoglycan hydrolase-like protein with peptidoglycan-binding domain